MKTLSRFLLAALLVVASSVSAQSGSKIVFDAVANGQTGAMQTGARAASVTFTFCGTGFSGNVYVDAAATQAGLAQVWTTALTGNSDCTTTYTKSPATKWYRVRWTRSAGTLNVWMLLGAPSYGSGSYADLTAPTGCVATSVPIFLGSPVALGCDAGLTYDAAPDTLTLTGNYTATLGAELLANSSFVSDLGSWTAGAGWAWADGAGWAWDGGGAKHTGGGGTATLAQDVAVVSGLSYQVAFAISEATTGSISISLGAVALDAAGTTTFGESREGIGIVADATGSVALTITPTDDFDGTLDAVSIKAISAAPASYAVADGSGALLEVRGSHPRRNLFVGYGSGRLATTGTGNVAIGPESQYSLTTGTDNVASGYLSQYSLTTGTGNVASGYLSQYSLTTGSANVASGHASQSSLTTGSANVASGHASQSSLTTGTGNVASGYLSQYSLTTGTGNVASGYLSQYSLTTGSGNVASGHESGYNSGASPSSDNAITTSGNTTFIGYQSGLGSPTQRTNATAIGANAYVDADNTVVLGDANVTDVLAGSTGAARVNAGTLKLSNLPVYADNTAALGGGLTAGQVYRTSTGVLMVTY